MITDLLRNLAYFYFVIALNLFLMFNKLYVGKPVRVV